MTDDRDNPEAPPPEPPAPPPLPEPAPPPMAAPPAPAAPAAPPPAAAAPPPMAATAQAAPMAPPGYAPAPARSNKTPLIVGAIVGGLVILAAILYFTGVFGGGLSKSSLAGTWGPGCPGSSGDTITFTSSGTFTAGGGSGTYTLSGDRVTLYRLDGRNGSFAMRWEMVNENTARVTNVNNGSVDRVYRCR